MNADWEQNTQREKPYLRLSAFIRGFILR